MKNKHPVNNTEKKSIDLSHYFYDLFISLFGDWENITFVLITYPQCSFRMPFHSLWVSKKSSYSQYIYICIMLKGYLSICCQSVSCILFITTSHNLILTIFQFYFDFACLYISYSVHIYLSLIISIHLRPMNNLRFYIIEYHRTEINW